MIKKIIFLGLSLAILGAGIGMFMFNKPLEGIESMTTDFKMIPDSLLSAFENDESAANQKYLDKVIEVSGTVYSIAIENDKTSVYLDTDNELSKIIFQLESNDDSILEGQKVTMKGICTGFLMDVVLVRAQKLK